MILPFVTFAAALANAAVLALLYRQILRMRGAYRDHVSALREELAAKDAMTEAHRARADVYENLSIEQARFIALLAGPEVGISPEGNRPPSIH